MSTHELHLNHPITHDHMWALELLFWLLAIMLLGHVLRGFLGTSATSSPIATPAAVESDGDVGDFWGPEERARMRGEDPTQRQG